MQETCEATELIGNAADGVVAEKQRPKVRQLANVLRYMTETRVFQRQQLEIGALDNSGVDLREVVLI